MTKSWPQTNSKHLHADDKFKFTKRIISFFDRVENIVEREEKLLVISIFYFFPQYFQKLSVLGL